MAARFPRPALWPAPVGLPASRAGERERCGRAEARSGPGLRHRHACEHGAVPGVARCTAALRAPRHRLRLRIRDPRYRCGAARDRKSTRLNSSHGYISYAVFCLKKKKKTKNTLFARTKKKTNKE